jgi:anaerobic selenocysteine-containing dehydrogenase
MKLDLLVVADLFKTPTTSIADIILPVATCGEHETVGYWSMTAAAAALKAYPKLSDPPGEAWSDAKWINELANRVGLKDDFWDSDNGYIEEMTKPSGLDWDSFCQQRAIKPGKETRKLEDIVFDTPSGKIELYSEDSIKQFGHTPIPTWKELSVLSFNTSPEFPLLMTSRVEDAFKLTGFKGVKFMRDIKNQPEVEINSQTASDLGLKEGDWAYIETKNGRIKQRVVLDPDLDPHVVYVSYGWWFPETESNLCEWDKSNINILLDNERAELASGTVETRGIPCRVYKDKE